MFKKASWIFFSLLLVSFVLRKYGITGGSLLLNLSSVVLCAILFYKFRKPQQIFTPIFLSVFLLFDVALLHCWLPLYPAAVIIFLLFLSISFILFKTIKSDFFSLSIWILTGLIGLSSIIFNPREFHNFYRSTTYEDFMHSKYSEWNGIVADVFIDKFKKPDKIKSEKYFLMARKADSLGENESALKYYNTCIDINPDNPVAYFRRGFLKLTRIDLNADVAVSAVKDFSKAIRLDSSYTMAYFQRALAVGYLGNKGRSLLDMKKVWEADSILSDEDFNRRYGISKKSFSIPFHP